MALSLIFSHHQPSSRLWSLSELQDKWQQLWPCHCHLYIQLHLVICPSLWPQPRSPSISESGLVVHTRNPSVLETKVRRCRVQSQPEHFLKRCSGERREKWKERKKCPCTFLNKMEIPTQALGNQLSLSGGRKKFGAWASASWGALPRPGTRRREEWQRPSSSVTTRIFTVHMYKNTTPPRGGQGRYSTLCCALLWVEGRRRNEHLRAVPGSLPWVASSAEGSPNLWERWHTTLSPEKRQNETCRFNSS